jgi:hypothetical protein
MQISLYGQSGLELSDSNRQVYLVKSLAAKDQKSLATGGSVIINLSGKGESKKLAEGGILVAGTGEYELGGVFISAQSNQEGAEALDLVEVELDGVRVLVYGDAKDVNKQLLEQLGVIDVLVIEVAENFEQQLKAVSTVDPQVVIPVGNSELVTKFLTELGVVSTTEKKFKAKAADFATEEYILKALQLVA